MGGSREYELYLKYFASTKCIVLLNNTGVLTLSTVVLVWITVVEAVLCIVGCLIASLVHAISVASLQ